MNPVLHAANALLPGGWAPQVRLLLDANGGIIQIRHGPPEPGDQRLSGPVIPGVPNLHSHGFQRLMAGLTARSADGRDSFWSWREAMYQMALRLDPDDLERCMAGVFMEMLRSGYTTCAEFHYLHHAPDGSRYDNPVELSERVFAAAATTGMSLTHLPVWYQRSGFGAGSTAPEQRRFANGLDEYLEIVDRCTRMAGDHPGARVGIAPHSLRAVAAERLGELLDRVEDDMPVHIHVAEQALEVSQSIEYLGARPVQWLLDHAPVGPGWCLVHATHLEDRECRMAASSGAVAGLCPTTEADLGDGVFPAAAWLDSGGRFGIGSDSNLRLCPAEELRLLEGTQRLATGRRNVLADPGQSTGENLLSRAAEGGALATAQPVGAIEAGRRADLLELDPGHPLLAGLAPDKALDTWLFAGGPDMIRSVRVSGRVLVDAGRHVNEPMISAGFRQVLEKLRR